ncbi:hypothetical protein Rsub_07172 [Raphidocelis subcapitata]|uniref:Uncharacterized protein n=1 Tax=Raphidocelis subcapitata TaxID=307507 RepID=A0A2V0PAQ9_9CHLO|nr:hypothetical protein Rsub_07172 [Raphidocelis subcapitata]|eukprot:GBF94185.1 hypothetical protein Rsub_07172 [Raphidocelis subcapitata]
MAVSPLAAALSAVAIAMGAGIFYHFNFGLEEYMGPLKDACGLNGPPKGPQPEFLRLGNPFLDGLHCLVTPFFLDCVATPVGRFWVLKTLEVCTPLVVFMALEESRSSARGLVRATVAVLALSQLLGVSVALPCLWVPSFLLLSRPRVAGAFLPAGKVPAIVASQAITLAFTAVLVCAATFPPAAAQRAVVWFNLGIPATALIWMLAPGGARPGNAAAAAALRLTAGAACLLHAASVVDLLYHSGGSPGAAWASIVDAAQLKPPAKVTYPAHFMQWDFTGVTGAALLVTLAEEGVAGAARLLAMAPVVGPGAAFALVAARREERLGGAAGAGARGAAKRD